MLVLDASAAVELLLGTARGRRVAAHLFQADAVSPALLDVEVASATVRLERTGVLGRQDADQVVARLAQLPVDRLPHDLLLQAAWNRRDSVRIADAFYLACAEITGAPVLTCDGRLARAPLGTIAVTIVT